MERWRPIAESLPNLKEENTRKIERLYTRALLKARSLVSELRTTSELVEKNKLSDEEIEAIQLDISDSEMDTSIIWHANSFFRYHRGTSETKFSLIARNVSGQLYISRRSSQYFYWPSTPIVDILDYKVASVLLSSMNLSEQTSMSHMLDLGEVFVCQRCHPVLRRKFTWDLLVRTSAALAWNEDRRLNDNMSSRSTISLARPCATLDQKTPIAQILYHC